jgi:dipeptidyl aminopeptidase/acylaminoacyl peptidase
MPPTGPDGRGIAYAACTGPERSPSCDIHVLPLDARLEPTGPARVLARQGLSSQGLCWTRDGRSLVYGANAILWRLSADGGLAPERLELAGFAVAPATVGSRDRLAFVRLTGDVDVYRLEAGGVPRPLVQSTLLERQASISPDGRRIAFQAGEPARGFDIWLADADGSNPTRLTRGPERLKGSASWSPDGRSLAFDARGEDTQRDVWTIDVDGSGLRRVTESAANDFAPSWSRDGRFLYFTSDRTGRAEVFRVPAGGGPEEQLTHAGGTQPIESLDGRELYYQRSQDGPLLVRAAAGGDREARPCVRTQAWAVAPHGVVYQPCEGTGEADAPRLFLRSWNARSGADRPWGSVDADGIDGLSVSPDGRSVLFGRARELSSLAMIEGFR